MSHVGSEQKTQSIATKYEYNHNMSMWTTTKTLFISGDQGVKRWIGKMFCHDRSQTYNIKINKTKLHKNVHY